MASLEAISGQMLRIIDANFNRVAEGLRLLEEIARLLLNDAVLTQQLKTMRHELIGGDSSFHQRLLQSRNSRRDVGINIEVLGDEKVKELPMVLVANARRVQEALRTLEELSKIPSAAPELDSDKFKQARFNLYTIEQELLFKLLRQDKIKHISGLYFIIDTQTPGGCQYLEVAGQAIRGGASAIQLRDKVRSKEKLLLIAHQLKSLCREHNVLFIMSDHLDVALDSDADGIHVEQDGLPAQVARKLLPLDKILGCTVTTEDQAITAQSAGVDYVAIGSVYPVSSKEDEEVVGLERLRQIRQAVSLPLVAIGGIIKDNVSDVMDAGADSVALISAVSGAEFLEGTYQQIVDILEIQK
ncbi:thiamine phosphate synthase [Chloroflexota bacterium]